MVAPTPIDIAQYAKAPQFNVHRGISLIGVTLKYVPEPASDDVAYWAEQLREVRDASREALRIRHRELGPSVLAGHLALDQLVDALHRIRFARLEQWMDLDGDGLRALADRQRLAQGEPGPVDWIALLDRAREAKRLHSRLFPNRVDYTRLSFEEQDEHMQTLADIIAEDGCRASLDALVGPELLAALDETAALYRQMIDDRAAHRRGSEVDLRTVQAALQGALQRYMIAVLATLRPDDPASVAQVRRALRPVDALREQIQLERARASGKSAEPGEPPSDPLSDPEAVDELLAAEQALTRELGLGEVSEPPLGA